MDTACGSTDVRAQSKLAQTDDGTNVYVHVLLLRKVYTPLAQPPKGSPYVKRITPKQNTQSSNPPTAECPLTLHTPCGNPVEQLHIPTASPPFLPSLPPLAARMPKRKITSVEVTRILRMMSTMMIQVMRVILTSAIWSERISARSRKTRQRSFRTWMRGLISRYSRTPW